MICVVIPTWNNYQHLKLTIESLTRVTQDTKFRIVVVDNASYDETPRYLREAGIESVRMSENVGFVKGTNAGLDLAKPGEHVMFLNDDVFVTDPFWLQRLSSRMVENVGAVGPVSNFVMGSQNMQNVPYFPLVHDAKFLIGFCLLVRADCFEKVGKIDERFLLGGNDDLDYSIRIAKAGYRMVVCRDVFMYHFGAKSISRIGGYEKVERETRPLLVEKWGKEEVEALFTQGNPVAVPA